MSKLFSRDLISDTVLEGCSSPEDDILFIESSEWVQDGKYQNKSYIFRHDGKFYRITDTRSGSPFSEWHHFSINWAYEIECDEVERFEVITYKWVQKK